MQGEVGRVIDRTTPQLHQKNAPRSPEENCPFFSPDDSDAIKCATRKSAKGNSCTMHASIEVISKHAHIPYHVLVSVHINLLSESLDFLKRSTLKENIGGGPAMPNHVRRWLQKLPVASRRCFSKFSFEHWQSKRGEKPAPASSLAALKDLAKK